MDADLLKTIGAVGAGGAGALGLVGSAALVRRRLSRDRTEIVKDRVEGDYVERLLKDRDAALLEAREAWRVRQVDVESIARLTSQNLYQAQEIARLGVEMAAFKRLLIRLYPDTRELLDSTWGAMAPAPPAAAAGSSP